MNGIFESIGLLIFRILFGISLIPHSFPKLNRDSNIQLKEYMAQIGIPTIFVNLSMLIELIGGILVMIGAFYILVDSVLTLFFLGATLTSIAKMKKPLPSISNPGYDLDILFLAGSILMLLLGPGQIALLSNPSFYYG